MATSRKPTGSKSTQPRLSNGRFASNKKVTPKKVAAKKAAPKKVQAKRAPTKKTAAARVASSSKSLSKRSAPKKAAPKKAAVKKAVAKKAAPKKKAPIKRAPIARASVKRKMDPSMVPQSKDFKSSVVTDNGGLSYYLELVYQRAKTPQVLYKQIAAEFANMLAERFKNSGPAPSYGVKGKWKALSTNTYGATSAGRRPLNRYGHLYHAATHPKIAFLGGMGMTIEIDPRNAKPAPGSAYSRGQNYATFHQTGSGSTPKREIVPKIVPGSGFGLLVGQMAKNYFIPSKRQAKLPSERGHRVEHAPPSSRALQQKRQARTRRDKRSAEIKSEKFARQQRSAERSKVAKARRDDMAIKQAQKLEDRLAKQAARERIAESKKKIGTAKTMDRSTYMGMDAKAKAKKVEEAAIAKEASFAEHVFESDAKVRFAKHMGRVDAKITTKEHLAKVQHFNTHDTKYRKAAIETHPAEYVPPGTRMPLGEYKKYRGLAKNWARRETFDRGRG